MAGLQQTDESQRKATDPLIVIIPRLAGPEKDLPILRKVMVATSYLAEHDPSEVEVHPADDGERATYCRKSLPGMAGALNKNISRLRPIWVRNCRFRGVVFVYKPGICGFPCFPTTI